MQLIWPLQRNNLSDRFQWIFTKCTSICIRPPTENVTRRLYVCQAGSGFDDTQASVRKYVDTAYGVASKKLTFIAERLSSIHR